MVGQVRQNLEDFDVQETRRHHEEIRADGIHAVEVLTTVFLGVIVIG